MWSSTTKKPQSDVWEYFEAVHGEKKVKCLLCNPHKEIAFHGDTANLQLVTKVEPSLPI